MSIACASYNQNSLKVNSRGELCSFTSGERELLWGGARPDSLKLRRDRVEGGWPHTAPVMFPLIGPPQREGDREFIELDGQQLRMPQHGFARKVDYNISRDGEHAIYAEYVSQGSPIRTLNGIIEFPFKHRLAKEFWIDDFSLNAAFSVVNTDERPLHFDMGWHPAFRPLRDGVIKCGKDTLSLSYILSKGTVLLPNSRQIVYSSPKYRIEVEHNFGNTWVWAQKLPSGEVPLICIEPVTGMPSFDSKPVGSWRTHSLSHGEATSFWATITPKAL
jgi:galactose mutarotase-like enzyme